MTFSVTGPLYQIHLFWSLLISSGQEKCNACTSNYSSRTSNVLSLLKKNSEDEKKITVFTSVLLTIDITTPQKVTAYLFPLTVNE